jgi:hypothetical protein
MINALLLAAAAVSQPTSNLSAYRPYLDCYWAHLKPDWQFDPADDDTTTTMLTSASQKCASARSQGRAAWEGAIRNNPNITADVRRAFMDRSIFGLWSDDMIARLLPSGRAQKFVFYLQRLGKERALRLS